MTRPLTTQQVGSEERSRGGMPRLLELDQKSTPNSEALRDLVALSRARVPVLNAVVFRLLGNRDAERLRALLHELLLAASDTGDGDDLVLITPAFPSRLTGRRLEGQHKLSARVSSEEEIESTVSTILDASACTEVTMALGGSSTPLTLLVGRISTKPRGGAASADPMNGDPDQIRVWENVAAPWLVDRRTARVTGEGEGVLDANQASLVADLADRAQLVLGHPVQIRFCQVGGKLAVVSVKRLILHPQFTPIPFRIVTLIADDEGTVAPMSVDALDRALREPEDPPDEAVVRRLFARPYRKWDVARRPVGQRNDAATLIRLTTRAARVAKDVASPIGSARRFERDHGRRLALLDSMDLTDLDTDGLMSELRERQRIVSEAMALLDRLRAGSMAILAALEATVGKLPRQCFPALAQPRATRSRRRVNDRLLRMSRRIEQEIKELAGPERLSPALKRKWDELKHSLRDVRNSGLDIRPLPYGASDATLLAALKVRYGDLEATHERARRDAARRLLTTARTKSLGRSRETIVSSLTLLLGRVASAKGAVAEALASALLSQREAAVEAGARMVELGFLDDSEDALYMHVAEVGQALSGEPGAYAARVRLRREDDMRWSQFDAPRRIERRRRRTLAEKDNHEH